MDRKLSRCFIFGCGLINHTFSFHMISNYWNSSTLIVHVVPTTWCNAENSVGPRICHVFLVAPFWSAIATKLMSSYQQKLYAKFGNKFPGCYRKYPSVFKQKLSICANDYSYVPFSNSSCAQRCVYLHTLILICPIGLLQVGVTVM